MEKESLGLIETVGLIPAIEAADAGSKAANVVFRGMEQARAGLITVFFVGDVAAVRAAVTAGAVAARQVGKVVSVHVIARPDRQLHISPNGSHPAKKKVEAPSAAAAQPALSPEPETVEVEVAPLAEEIVLEEVAVVPIAEADVIEVVEVKAVPAPAPEPEPVVAEAVIEIAEETVEPAEEELVVAAAVSTPQKKEKEKVRKTKSKKRF